MEAPRTLDPDKQLVSDLWLDQPDAGRRIDRGVAGGSITEEEAEQLRHFSDRGYARLHLDLDDEFLQGFEDELERLWRERPYDLAVAPVGGGRRSMRDLDVGDRTIGFRIADLHGHSDRALALYLHPQVFRLVELILGHRAIAFQSLYFPYGSEQSLHRDPMFVPTDPPSHLVATWTALEDITADAGPLLYVPGSHRMPWYESAPDVITIPKQARTSRQGWVRHRARMMQEMGLEVQELTCSRGDVFFWHAGLLHGGAKVRDPSSTRRSFVVHYSTAAAYRSRRATMAMRSVEGDDATWRSISARTDRILERDGCLGLDAPLKGADAPAVGTT